MYYMSYFRSWINTAHTRIRSVATHLVVEQRRHLRQEVIEKTPEEALFAARVTGSQSIGQTLPVGERRADERPTAAAITTGSHGSL